MWLSKSSTRCQRENSGYLQVLHRLRHFTCLNDLDKSDPWSTGSTSRECLIKAWIICCEAVRGRIWTKGCWYLSLTANQTLPPVFHAPEATYWLAGIVHGSAQNRTNRGPWEVIRWISQKVYWIRISDSTFKQARKGGCILIGWWTQISTTFRQNDESNHSDIRLNSVYAS